MGIIIKNAKEIELMKKSGKILAETLELVCKNAKPGISTLELDKIAEDYIRSRNGIPAFKNYHGFPASICSAVNEIVVHGIPNNKQILKDGDLFTVDCGVIFEGMYSDAARSIGIGEVNNEKTRLIQTAHKALENGLKQAKPGNHLGEISKAIEDTIKNAGFHIIEDLTGHGIGHQLHEDPVVLNYWDGDGPLLKDGMTLAVEPIFSSGTKKIKTLNDNWTIVTNDGSPSIQIEETILITKESHEILTKS